MLCLCFLGLQILRFEASKGSYKSAEHAQAIDAAIGNDIDPKMRHRAHVHHVSREDMEPIRLQFLLRKQLPPEHGLCGQRGIAAAGHIRCLNRATIRIISLEMSRIELDSLDTAAVAEREQRPFIARLAATMRLPALGHVRAQSREDDAERCPVMLVAAGDEAPAVGDRGEIDGGAAIALL